jgi:hypothetical protein
MKRYVAALLVVLGVVGVVGVLAVGIGTGSAKDEDDKDEDAGAKCSEATLHGTYLVAYQGVEIKGDEQLPFADAGYDVFDGNGKVDTVFSGNANGETFRKERFSGTYTVKADCTGTGTFGPTQVLDYFIAPDGSKFTFVFVKPKSDVATGFEERVTAKRVAQ